ncbi:MAG TPA: response regulator [Ignavibacteria bacterium]|nr:response regulator [Ignavibacteria bacterium]
MNNQKVLVVEDNEEVRFLVKEVLKQEQYAVTDASDGQKALEIALGENFDIIVCDVQMPKMNGFDFLRILSKQTNSHRPNFIFLTGKNERKDMRTGMELGADDFITKPFKPEELTNAVKAQLRKRENLKAAVYNDDSLLNSIKSLVNPSIRPNNKSLNGNEKIFITTEAYNGFLSIEELTAINSVKDYTKLLMKDGTVHFVRKPIKTWEEKLPPADFVRIHRQTIININHIKKVDKWFNYSFKISMSTTDKVFYSSQRYSVKLRDKLRAL